MNRIVARYYCAVYCKLCIADEGMWTFDNPPLKQGRKSITSSRQGMARPRAAGIGNISRRVWVFVSPNGLIATNHHVASVFIERLSSKDAIF